MLRKGSTIQAKLIEVVEKDKWIVSFEGDLLQVQNSANIKFQEGLKLTLYVVSIKPLSLKVVQSSSALYSDLVKNWSI